MAKEFEEIHIPKKVKRFVKFGIFGLLGLIVVMSSLYTVEEGHVGIVKRFSKAIAQVDPGLRVKIPFVDSIEMIEVRQRKNTEKLTGATNNQLPITATVSINWTVDKASAMSLFVEYGSLTQFEQRVLDPKLRSTGKAAIAKYPADELIRTREQAVGTLMEMLTEAVSGFPVVLNSPQIENITFPPMYVEAIEAQEKAREDAEKEEYNLARQKLEIEQRVQTADAESRAIRALANANADRIRIEAEAEAERIRLVNAQLSSSPYYVQLRQVEQWDGKLPRMLLSGDEAAGGILLNLNPGGK